MTDKTPPMNKKTLEQIEEILTCAWPDLRLLIAKIAADYLTFAQIERGLKDEDNQVRTAFAKLKKATQSVAG